MEKMKNNKEKPNMYLTENQVDFETTRSSGPGGQNVNKRSTAVRLRAKIEDIDATDEELEFIKENLPPRHRTKEGEILIENSESRSQEQNRDNALKVANEEIKKAIEKGKQKRDREKHKKRARKAQKKGGGSGADENLKEKQKRQLRSETTEDLLGRAYEEDPDLRDRLSDD